MKAYMELVNNMLLTAEVQQTIVTPHTVGKKALGFFPVVEIALFLD